MRGCNAANTRRLRLFFLQRRPDVEGSEMQRRLLDGSDLCRRTQRLLSAESAHTLGSPSSPQLAADSYSERPRPRSIARALL